MASVACKRCGKSDPTLRLTVFPWVVSVVLLSFKRGAVGIYCETCRSAERWKYVAISALVGWWGIPWGIFWTFEALARNLGGGQLPAAQNAGFLAELGQEFLDSGDREAARATWTASLRFRKDPVVERALQSLPPAWGSPAS